MTTFLSTMLTPCGPLDGCVISMVVKLLTYNPSISMVGSGLAQGQGWGQLIKHLLGGKITPGHIQVRKNNSFNTSMPFIFVLLDPGFPSIFTS